MYENIDATDPYSDLDAIIAAAPAPVEKPKRPRKKKKGDEPPPIVRQDAWRSGLITRAKCLFDFQRLRMQVAGRINRATGPETQLAEGDVVAIRAQLAEVALLEKHALANVHAYLMSDVPFYRDVLRHLEGVGDATAAVILSMFDVQKADTVSKFWAFAGLRPVPCRRCSKCQRVVTPAKDGSFKHPATKLEDDATKCSAAIPAAETFESSCAQRPVAGEKLPYSAFLRSKLCGALASALITNGRRHNGQWVKVYDDYKHRKQTAGWGVSDGHRNNAAKRYMVKMFLLDLWKRWREYEGLPVRPSYHEEKQGHVHRGQP